jgi:hypothetical protein
MDENKKTTLREKKCGRSEERLSTSLIRLRTQSTLFAASLLAAHTHKTSNGQGPAAETKISWKKQRSSDTHPTPWGSTQHPPVALLSFTA